MPEPLLQIRDLNVAFETSRGDIRPVRDSNLTIYPGQTTAVVGESGCGKSVTAMSILKLLPEPPAKYLSGQIFFQGRDLLKNSEREMRAIRGKDIAMIFQEPMTSLNPVYTIGDQIVEAVALHQGKRGRAAYEIAEKFGVKVVRNLIGPYITSLEMAGTSITVLKMDDDMLKLWDAPVKTPGLRWGV